jgi:hypothetical protein
MLHSITFPIKKTANPSITEAEHREINLYKAVYAIDCILQHKLLCERFTVKKILLSFDYPVFKRCLNHFRNSQAANFLSLATLTEPSEEAQDCPIM